MKKYTVNIEETLNQEFDIIANSAEEALEIGIKQYSDGNIVLSPGELTNKQIAIVQPEKSSTRWVAF